MHVWIIQTGEPLHCDSAVSRGMRTMNASDALSSAGHTVTIWSSDFYHQEKRHRYGCSKTIKINDNITIQLIPSCGYQKNLSIKRFVDHRQLGKEFIKAVSGHSIPDIAIVGFPPIEIAREAVNYLESRNVPVLLDVKDQWPEIFVDALPRPLRHIGNVLFHKLRRDAKKTMRSATGLSSMAKPFLEWAAASASREIGKFDLVCPLVAKKPFVSPDSKKESLDWWIDRGVQKWDGIRALFVGTLSHHSDFRTPLRGFCDARKSGLDVQVVVCGDGDLNDSLRKEFENEDAVVFGGWVDYPKYEALTRLSNLAIIPYKPTSNYLLNTPNKMIDALSFGLPVITSLEGEIGRLINTNDIGWQYAPNEPSSVEHLLLSIMTDKPAMKTASENALKIYNLHYEHGVVYRGLVNHLECMVDSTLSY